MDRRVSALFQPATTRLPVDMTTPERFPELTLVLGATGKTGGRVAALLTDLGLSVRPGSRTASPAFDWDDRSTWDRALEGVGAGYVTFQPDLAVAGAAETVGAFADRAVAR